MKDYRHKVPWATTRTSFVDFNNAYEAIDSNGRTIWIADAHRGDRKRFVVRADEELTALGLCGHIGKGVLVSGLKMGRNFLHRQLTGRSVAAENIHVVVDVADRANRRVIPASAFAAFGANSFTPFFMRKLLHNGNDALKRCTVASPPLPHFEIACVLVRFDHVTSFILNGNHTMM